MAIKVNGCTVIDDDKNINAGISTVTTSCVTGTLTGGTICATAGFSGPGANLSNIPSAAISGGISALDVCTFSTSGTWTKPSSAKYVHVEVLGGGGGGMSYNRCEALTRPYSGGSLVSGDCGVGGKFITANYLASDLPPSIPVTIGAGGPAGGSYPYSCPGHYKPKGGASCFGQFLAVNVLTSNACCPGSPAQFCCVTGGTDIGNHGGDASVAYFSCPGWPGAAPQRVSCLCGCTAPSNANISSWTEATLGKYVFTGGAGGPCTAPFAGSPGPGYGGGGAGGFFGCVSISNPSGGNIYDPYSMCWTGAPGGSGPGGNGGIAAGGGAGAFGCPGGAGGNGRVVVYTWS